MALSPGAKLGRFEILRLAGQGGMGEVYEAIERTLDRRVALKTIRQSGGEDPKAIERFEREAKLLAAFSHPNAVTIYGLERIDGMLVLVMEWIDGVTLRDRSSDLTERLRWLREAAAALHALHQRGIIHRDLKPANMMIDKQSRRLRLLDFGIARLIEQDPTERKLTGTHDIVGTPRYMAPEQRAGSDHLDARVDQYAWGVIAFELLSGRPLAEAVGADVEPRAIREALSLRVNEDVAATVARTLAKSPDERFPSMADVDQALTLRPTESTKTMDVEPRRSPSRLARRRRLRIFFASASVVVVFGALGAVVAWTARREREGREADSPPAPVSVVTITEPLPPEAGPAPIFTASAPPLVDAQPMVVAREAGPPPRWVWRDVQLDAPLPTTVEAQAFREWFAKRKGALLGCYRANAPLKSCSMPLVDVVFECRVLADGTPRRCETASASMTSARLCFELDPTCFKNVLLAAPFPPPKSGANDVVVVAFRAIE